MRALALADEVFIGAVNRAEKVQIGDRFDSQAVAQHLVELGVTAHSAPTNVVLLEKLIAGTKTTTGKRRVVVFFTNGSFDGIISKYVTEMRGA